MQNEHVPMVSVCIQTYNHAAFIAQCLDSVLEQETDFNYEIILGEDDSNDGTRAICQEYQQKYPGKIRLFLRSAKDKIFIDGVQTGRFNFMENIRAANGKYIALLDGDDYWIDPLKLQKQVEQMENDSTLVVSCGKVVYLFPDGKLVEKEKRVNSHKKKFGIKDALMNHFYPMSTLFFKNHIPFEFPPFINSSFFGDISLVWWLTKDGGKIGILENYLSVYRIHEKGISKTTNLNIYDRNYHNTLGQFDVATNYKYTKYIKGKRFTMEFEYNGLNKTYGYRIVYFFSHLFSFIDNWKYIGNKWKLILRYLLPLNSIISKFKNGY